MPGVLIPRVRPQCTQMAFVEAFFYISPLPSLQAQLKRPLSLDAFSADYPVMLARVLVEISIITRNLIGG